MTSEILECISEGFGEDCGCSSTRRASGRAAPRRRSSLKELVITFQGELDPAILTEFELLRTLPMLEKLKIHQQLKDPRKVTTC